MADADVGDESCVGVWEGMCGLLCCVEVVRIRLVFGSDLLVSLLADMARLSSVVVCLSDSRKESLSVERSVTAAGRQSYVRDRPARGLC